MTRFLLAIALTVITALSAHAQEGLTRTEIRRVEAPGAPAYEVVVSRLEIAPGARVPLHTHPGDEHMVVVVGGTMLAPNGQTIPFAPGDTAHFPAGQVHGGLQNTGDTTMVAMTTHIVEKGAPFMTLAE